VKTLFKLNSEIEIYAAAQGSFCISFKLDSELLRRQANTFVGLFRTDGEHKVPRTVLETHMETFLLNVEPLEADCF
jgi:hypothetical protein